MTASTAAGNAGIGSWIERRARAAPDGVALIAGDRSLTYSELADRVRRLANGLRTLGVAKGDRVAWLGPNHPAFLESLFAAGLLGAAMAPVNHRLDAAEISWVLEDIKPRVLIQHVAAGATAVRGPGSRRVAVGGSLDGAADFEALVAASPGHADRGGGRAGRLVPAAAHLGHDRPAEGGDAHPRQCHLERCQSP